MIDASSRAPYRYCLDEEALYGSLNCRKTGVILRAAGLVSVVSS